MIVFLKNTIFKSKIQTRSEVEIKLYFQKWLEQIQELGYLDPKRYTSNSSKAVVSLERSCKVEETKELMDAQVKEEVQQPLLESVVTLPKN